MRRLFALGVVLAAACSDYGAQGIDYLVLEPVLDTLYVADTLAPPYAVTYVSASGGTHAAGTLTWSSSSQSIATVDPVTGLVIGVAPGSAVITARKAGVFGNAIVVVTRRVDVTALLNTIVLMPGDTMTVPVHVRRKDGPPPAPWFEASAQSAFTIDSASGRVTGISKGGPFPFIVHADTVTDTGSVLVWTQADTAAAGGSFSVSGTLTRQDAGEGEAITFSRAVDGNLATRINLVGASGGSVNDVEIRLQAALTATGTYVVDSISPNELFSGNATCRPPRNWGLFSTRTGLATPTRASSRQNGSLTITRMDAVPGGHLIGGRFQFTAQRFDMAVDPLAEVIVRGTFVMPLLTHLTDCAP